MNLANAVFGDRACVSKPATINPFLDGDVSFGLELQIALVRLLAVVVLESALDIDRVGVMPFDEIAVIAIHRANEIGQGSEQAGGQAAAKPGGFLHEINREVCQRTSESRCL